MSTGKSSIIIWQLLPTRDIMQQPCLKLMPFNLDNMFTIHNKTKSEVLNLIKNNEMVDIHKNRTFMGMWLLWQTVNVITSPMLCRAVCIYEN